MRSFQDAAPEISKNVPMLMGSVSEEGNRMLSRPTEAEWHATLARVYGEEKATALVTGLKKAHPEKSIRTLSYMCSGPGLNALGHAEQCGADGEAEARTEGSAGLHVLLHVAIADAGGCGRVAHGRAGILLRQHQAVRAGHGQYARGAGAGEEDGDGVGELCAHRESEPAGTDVGAD